MGSDTAERRLAAIMFADVAGYSRLMGEDQYGTLHALQGHRFAVIDPTIGAHRGRIVKRMGDGILAIFLSAREAVGAALDIQRRLGERTAAEAPDRRIRLRIAVHLGEVLIDDDDIYGDDVNIAARVQEIAQPGGVAITSAVLAQIDGEIDAPFSDLGAHTLKNIARPVRVFHHDTAEGAGSPRAAFRPFIDLPEPEAPRITGGCLCGAIRYEIGEEPLGSMLCHCRICQRFSGAPILAGTTVLADTVTFTKGAPTYYRSSSIAERGFCNACGTSMIYKGTVGQWTKWLMIFTATLDEPEKYPPTYHLGIESKLPWMHVHDDLPRTRCTDSPSLIEAYRAVGEEVP